MDFRDEILQSQKNGEYRGAPLGDETLNISELQNNFRLIEAICNQVYQFSGYKDMTLVDFVRFVNGIAAKNQFPLENVILGSDHLGSNVWQNEPAESVIEKSVILIKDFIKAGFVKVHLDYSMP